MKIEFPYGTDGPVETVLRGIIMRVNGSGSWIVILINKEYGPDVGWKFGEEEYALKENNIPVGPEPRGWAMSTSKILKLYEYRTSSR